MLEKINKDQVPIDVFKDSIADIDFIEYYISSGMFGVEPDYLLVLEKTGETAYYGYVYNGNAPQFSEFGSFGISENKTARIW